MKQSGLLDFYSGRTVLVAGAGGFLGGHCLRWLRLAGARTIGFARRPPANPRAADAWVVGTLADAGAVRAAAQGCSLVFDFAGASGAVDSNRDIHQNMDAEFRPHATLFATCAELSPPPSMVFCSTRLVYGRPREIPVSESHPASPDSLYAVHKLMLEHYLRILCSNYGMGYTVIRLSNPYGPGSAYGGKAYGVINQFIDKARRGEKIVLFGDGRQTRDYIFVDDVMLAFLLCAATPACRGETFNLGCEHTITVRAAAEAIVERLGGGIDCVPWPEHYRRVETGDYATDLGKLRRLVNLPPQATFEQGLERMLGAPPGGAA